MEPENFPLRNVSNFCVNCFLKIVYALQWINFWPRVYTDHFLHPLDKYNRLSEFAHLCLLNFVHKRSIVRRQDANLQNTQTKLLTLLCMLSAIVSGLPNSLSLLLFFHSLMQEYVHLLSLRLSVKYVTMTSTS